MKRTLIVLLIGAATMFAGGAAYAHHSFAATYFVDQEITVEGTLTQFTQEHVTRDTLKPGDHVVVTGNPGRDPSEHRIRLHKIVRPSDGWKWEGVIM